MAAACCTCISWIVAEKISWYCAMLLMLLLVLNCCEDDGAGDGEVSRWRYQPRQRRPCDEFYEVREGETLQTISEKCGDPFILEENPHIQDFDDVYPGLIIKISSFEY